MVDEIKIKQILMKRRDEMSLEEFDAHLKHTNRLYGTNFKTDDFIPCVKDIYGDKI